MDPGARTAQAPVAASGPGAAGAAAGVLAALVMVLFMAAVAAAGDDGALEPLRAAGATFRGRGGSDLAAVAWGLLLHLGAGALLGVVFAALVPADFRVADAAMLGAGGAVLLLGLAASTVLPVVAPVLDTELRHRGGSWVIAHALFGAALGLAPALRRRHPGRERPIPLRPRTSP